MKINLIWTLMLIIMLVFFPVQAQESMTISGNVSSYNGIEPGLEVTLNRVADDQISRITSTITDPSGAYSFEIEPGNYLVNVTFQGSTHHSMVSPMNPLADFELYGRIEGWVTHGGGKNVSGISVKLLSSYGTVCATTTTDESGHYEFTHVNLSEHTVQADYMYVGYSSAKFVVNRSSSIANITIFDSTTQDTNIRVVADHIIIGQDMNGPWVQEYIQFMNMGNTSYYAPSGVYVGIGTPLKIKDLQADIMDCCRVQEDERLWVDPMEPMRPGDTTEATISYYLDTRDDEYIFEKDILYPSSYIMVFGDADSGIDLSSQVTATDTENLDGRNYDVLRFAHPNPGDTLLFTIRGYTLPGRNSSGSNDWSVYLGLGILIVIILAYPVISGRGKDSVSGPIQRPSDLDGINEPHEYDVSHMSRQELEAEKLKIFEELRSLNYQLEDGMIQEDEYDEFRAEYKAEALEIIRRLKEMDQEESVPEENTSDIDLSGTVKDLIDQIRDIDDVGLLEDALEAEMHDKNRKTLINALNRRIDELEDK